MPGVMNEFKQPVALITKSVLIERDIDILKSMAARHLVHITISFTTQDHQISQYLAPEPLPLRLETIQRLAESGIPVGINVAPVIPFLTDHEMEASLSAVQLLGASSSGYILWHLPWC